MKYYKITYQIGEKNERIYPAGIEDVVWTITQDHFTEHVMVGGTHGQANPDGQTVIELSEQEALALIEEFKKTYPEVRQEDRVFPGQPRE